MKEKNPVAYDALKLAIYEAKNAQLQAKKENNDPNSEFEDGLDVSKNEIVAGVQDSIESFKFSNTTSLR